MAFVCTQHSRGSIEWNVLKVPLKFFRLLTSVHASQCDYPPRLILGELHLIVCTRRTATLTSPNTMFRQESKSRGFPYKRFCLNSLHGKAGREGRRKTRKDMDFCGGRRVHARFLRVRYISACPSHLRRPLVAAQMRQVILSRSPSTSCCSDLRFVTETDNDKEHCVAAPRQRSSIAHVGQHEKRGENTEGVCHWSSPWA